MARRLGLDPDAGEVLAEVLPQDKAARSSGCARAAAARWPWWATESTMRPHYATADVGMAMGNGTDVACMRPASL